jgi:hypothetical protein
MKMENFQYYCIYLGTSRRRLQLLKIHSFIILCSIFTTVVYSQDYTTVVLDSATLKPIPFYNVDCGKIFNFGDEQGSFKLDAARKCTISCIGYNSKTVNIDRHTDTIILSPSVNKLDKITLVGSRETKTKKVGPVNEFQLFPKSSRISGHWYKGTILMYIANKDSLSGKIKKILIPLRKKCNFLIYRVSLLSVNSHLRPSSFLLDSDIILRGYELKDHIDISEYNIDFPNDGLFISFHWYLPENGKRQIQELKGNEQLDTNCLVIPIAKNVDDPRVYVRFGDIEIFKRVEKEKKLGDFIFIPKWGIEIIETD